MLRRVLTMGKRIAPSVCGLIILILISDATAHAAWEVDTGVGVGSERLVWSIAGIGGPNILSELTFQRTTTVAGQLRGRWINTSRWVAISADFTGGSLMSGSVRDDDYLQDNRQGLISSSLSAIDGNAILSWGLALEGRLLRQDRPDAAELWALTGWRWSRQIWRITRGMQVVPPLGPIENLNSTYRARWHGPEVGLRAAVPLSAFQLRGRLSWWPLLWYAGQGKWNLRDDFRQDPSFEHRAGGWGVGTDLQARYRFGKGARGHIGIGWQWQWMATASGTDRVFFSDDMVLDTTFNGAQRQGQMVYLTAGWTF